MEDNNLANLSYVVIGFEGHIDNLSKTASVVETAILQIPEYYPMMSVDKYCVMPDYVHMILSINTDENGRQVAAPTLRCIASR